MRKSKTADIGSTTSAPYRELPTSWRHREAVAESTSAPHNILIIDDNESVCRALTRYLKDSADTILSAGSFEEAMEILHKVRIHALICDFNLGPDDPNGVQIVEAVRKTRPEIRRAVILTGESITTIPSSASVDAVLEKGGNFLLLRALVEKKR